MAVGFSAEFLKFELSSVLNKRYNDDFFPNI